VVRRSFSRRVRWPINCSATATLATSALGMAIDGRDHGSETRHPLSP
jgi:hypothetical protein